MSKTSASELGQPLADQQSPAKVYLAFPDAVACRTAFLDLVKQTNEPETFPGLAHYPPPTKDAVFLLVVDEFVVDPSKRPDGEFIRCAACATRKKFKRGSLAWYPAEGVLRVVGNDCGDERRTEAVADYKRRSTLAVVNDYLDEHLPTVHPDILACEALRPAVRHAQELSLQLKTQGKAFCLAVNKAAKDGDGSLRIFLREVVEGVSDSRVMTTFNPSGLNFLKASFTPLRRLDEAIFRLRQADRGSPSKARRWLGSHREKLADLDAVYANLTTAKAKLREVQGLIQQALAFLAEENIQGVDAWATAHGSQVRAEWSPIFIVFRGRPIGGGTMQMTSLRPNWKLLRAAAGA
ncbi:hypothetical protein [Phenylobacterium sp. RIFCSPHIGHO2_01_FULL_69_31]|uniref:hypothetical protein n=1 Tax=Phenylobacterium sp. RIFCSPHIGHO2_01_FULL_69_31 TaxID=1801944 RepID=UPI0025EDC8ED|nr:hypothetical protein [Phenylobacterium sp. RIFCSPHIGHO2_01_FULL_69_31]